MENKIKTTKSSEEITKKEDWVLGADNENSFIDFLQYMEDVINEGKKTDIQS